MFGSNLLRYLIMRLKYALDLNEHYHVSWTVKDNTGRSVGHSIMTIRGGLYREDYETFIEALAMRNNQDPDDMIILSLTKLH